MKSKPTALSTLELFGKSAPQSSESEAALLGSILIDPACLPEVSEMVKVDDFADARHATVYGAILAVAERTPTLDLKVLAATLRDRRLDGPVGGEAFLLELARSTPTAVNYRHHATDVATYAQVRRTIDACGDTLYDCYHFADLGPNPAQELADRAEQRILGVVRQSRANRARDLVDVLQAELDRMAADDGEGVLKTGYIDLDTIMGGLHPGELTVLAARPSMGKTALMLNLAENMATRGHTVGIVSMEMSAGALAQRLIASRSGLDLAALRGGKQISDATLRAAMVACDEMKGLRILIEDVPPLSISSLRAKARRMAATAQPEVLMVDYLQLMTAAGGRESRQVEVSEISRGVKALAVELQIPVIALAQLNRSLEARADFRPRMSDLRESGSLEQDADNILLIHREEYYHRNDEKWLDDNQEMIGKTQLIVAKQRNGPTGIVDLHWNPTRTRFENAGERYRGAKTQSMGDMARALQTKSRQDDDREPAPVYAPGGDIWVDKAGGAA